MSDYRASFEQDGFAVVRGLLSAEDRWTLKEGLARFLRDIAPGIDGGHVMYEDPGDKTSLKQADCLHLEPSLDEFRHRGAVRKLAEALIGPVAPQHIEYFDKPPHNNRPTPPHQDGYYFCLVPNSACTIWAPLDAVDEDNGTLCYVRGSHRLGLLPHRATATLGFSQGLIPDPAALGEPVMCPAAPGDVLVHHSLTVHFANGNRTHRHRRSIGFVFYSANAKVDQEAVARYQAALKSQRDTKGIRTDGGGN